MKDLKLLITETQKTKQNDKYLFFLNLHYIKYLIF